VSEDSDRDLSAAFEELRAPSSTANYATRSPGFDVPSATRSRNWPQAVAAVTAVALALAGAGTFLALRSARQGGTPSRSGANPPARSGAAMAYDSSAGVTVMYGGADGSGKPLTDAWTWNGSDWMAAPKGPGPLVDVHMVDDPAAAGVLLVGMPAPKLTGGSGGGVVGCISSGSGTANPGSVSGATPAAKSGPPVAEIVPPSRAPAVAPTPVGTALPTCVFVDRCPLADELCREVVPPIVEVGPGRWTRCHHRDRLGELVEPPSVVGQDTVHGDRALSIEEVSKTFHQSGHDVPALVKVNLELFDGETLGLVGESGSGKSTLAKTLLGIESPDPGGNLELAEIDQDRG